MQSHFAYCMFVIMPAKLPDDVVHRIQLRLEYRESPVAIHKATKVSVQTIQQMQLNLDLFGQPYIPASIVLGRPRALLPVQEEVIEYFIYSI
jgi:hypothetical protein